MRKYSFIFSLVLAVGVGFFSSGCGMHSVVTDPELARQYELQNQKIVEEELRKWNLHKMKRARYPRGYRGFVASGHPNSDLSWAPVAAHMQHMDQIELSVEHNKRAKSRGY